MTKSQNKTESNLTEAADSTKTARKRRRNVKMAMPSQPALPVKALWEIATEEQRTKAHAAAATIMEYWLGKITKQEVAARLKTPPLRVWQLSQQAISGMVAGLLVQPKTRAPRGARNKGVAIPKDPENDPVVLRKRIEKLEHTVDMQERIIAVLREMPGCRDAKIPMEEPQSEAPKGVTAPDAAATPKTKKTTSPIPAGARHEVQPGSSGACADDLAKKVRSSD